MPKVGVLLAALGTLSLMSYGQSARILGIAPFPSKSHNFIFTALMTELASRGHQVTVVTSLNLESPPPNYREILIGNVDIFKQRMAGINMYDKRVPGFTSLMIMWGMGSMTCDLFLGDESMRKFIHSKEEQFDLIVIEAFINECFLGFVHKFNVPVVTLSAVGSNQWVSDTVGDPSTFSYIPNMLLGYSHHMTFTQRSYNTFVGLFTYLGRWLYYVPKQQEIMNRHFEEYAPIPSIRELETKTSVVLIISQVGMSYPKPMGPNMIQVGGMHLKPAKKLPKDLQKFLDEATEGVIYFSMGSNLRGADLPLAKRQAFLEAFSRVKEKVLWKWEEGSLPGQPSNVRIDKWLPQQDILAHRNVRLFITHGGMLSSQEALYHGVPLLGLPIYGDQSGNIRVAEENGFALRLDLDNITAECVQTALDTILNNPKYRENAKRLSVLFKDHPQTPMETAVYWTEYVLRHGGASHLRSAALDLAWYEYFLLDVLAVVAGGAVAVTAAIICVVKLLCRLLRGKKKTKKE